MRLKNTTNIPNDIVRALIQDVAPAGVTGVHFKITNSSGRGGRGRGWKSEVLVRIAKTERMARISYPARGAYLPGVYGSRMEALVHILAHELRHCWQSRHPKGWRVWGARGQYSERDADAYGLQMLRKFRRGELTVKPVPAQLEPVQTPSKAIRKATVPNTEPHKVLYKGVTIECNPGLSYQWNGGMRHRPSSATAETPAGKVFACNDAHYLECESTVLASAIGGIKQEIDGLVDCIDIDCDTCHPVDSAVEAA